MKSALLIFALVVTVKAQSSDHEVKYTDKLGIEWSRILDGKYENGCYNIPISKNSANVICRSDVVDEDSDAFNVCNDSGWSLPTREDWNRLVKEFDHVEHRLGVNLSDQGEVKFKQTFGYEGSKIFHSATVPDPELSYLGFTFIAYWRASADFGENAKAPELYSTSDRSEKHSVVCIRKPMF